MFLHINIIGLTHLIFKHNMKAQFFSIGQEAWLVEQHLIADTVYVTKVFVHKILPNDKYLVSENKDGSGDLYTAPTAGNTMIKCLYQNKPTLIVEENKPIIPEWLLNLKENDVIIILEMGRMYPVFFVKLEDNMVYYKRSKVMIKGDEYILKIPVIFIKKP